MASAGRWGVDRSFAVSGACSVATRHDAPLATATPTSDTEALRKRIRESTPYWAEKFAKIVDKQGRLVPLEAKAGQLEFDRQLEAQRADGKPMRALALKARQVGISTWVQAKAVHRCTLRERYDALTVAHDRETGAKLYRMAETIYANLPDDPELKPKLGQHRRQRFLHFAGDGLWTHGQAFPDSRYFVDTAGEFQAGRGGTYPFIHGSEVAFWAQIMLKLTALMAAVPDDPQTLIALESTANGFNEFKDLWDDAEEGRSAYLAFFWPWHKEEEYRLEFASETEKERFIVGDPTNPHAEEESDLVKNFDLELEQLHWRRYVIANKCGGDTRIFHQEFPSTPAEAFIATGQKVFDPYKAAQLMVKVDLSDPRTPTAENPGPLIGDLKMGQHRTDPTRSGGTIEVPTQALWTPRERGVINPSAPWRLWLPEEELERMAPVAPSRDPDIRPVLKSEYVVGVDVSGGNTENTRDPDYHVIEVIDHKTRQQIAEYRSRIDPDLLAREILLAALFFNDALVAIERTGSWGAAPLRILWHDYHYPHVYRSKKIGNANERIDQRLGWDTNVRTKPLLLAGMAELLRIGEDGIKSRVLANELRTYTRTEKGTTEAEPGKYDDALMAYMIAQQVAHDQPMKGTPADAPKAQGFAAGAGVAAYDSRYR